MLFRILVFIYFFNVCSNVNYYEVLGISKDSEIRAIRKAFKKLALMYHPDKNQGKEDAHEMFIRINKAYEVLKDQEMRKTYDLYGEEGLKEDFRKPWKGKYHSWNYYKDTFGIYDDDLEIVTLSHSDFKNIVLNSADMWFVNFYSPQCSHCHILAPSWRQMAHELQDVIKIGAVNCGEDWALCRQQNVYSYPSLILYTISEKIKYQGSREVDDLVEFVLQKVPDNVIWLTSANYKNEINSRSIRGLPWLIAFCKSGFDCVSKDDLKKIAIILENLVHVAEIFGPTSSHVCQWLTCESPLTYVDNFNRTEKGNLKEIAIEVLEVSEIVSTVLHLLPELTEISYSQLMMIINGTFVPTLIHFTTEEEPSIGKDIHLKRLESFLPEMNIGQFNCFSNNTICISLFSIKFPTFVLFREDGTYEISHVLGKATIDDISRFAREASKSTVKTLSYVSFMEALVAPEPWFIYFLTPSCPSCVQFLTNFRKVSKNYGHLVNFGSIDCSVHICSGNTRNSFPYARLYKDEVGHNYHGLFNENELSEFIEDVLNPVVVQLSPDSFQDKVGNKALDDVWVVDFYAPWCGSCQLLAPQWRKMAKMLKPFSYVHVGEVDCEIHPDFCSFSGVISYPTIALFPKGSFSNTNFFVYNEYPLDASSLQAWIYKFLPTTVTVLSDIDIQNVLQDDKPWIVYFFAPWCKHCKIFAPEFEKIAQKVEGRIKAGKINCVTFSKVCRLASIEGYPCVILYKGRTGSKPQNLVGKKIDPFAIDVSILENELGLKFKEMPLRDEL